MKRNDRLFQSVLLLLIITVLAGGVALAQGGYDLSWGTVDGGGTIASTGGAYSLGSSIGQPDAGSLSGGSYTLGGGFWGGGELTFSPATEKIYLPITLKN